MEEIALPAIDLGDSAGGARRSGMDGSSNFALFTGVSRISPSSAREQAILPTPTSPEWMMADKRRTIPRKIVPSSSFSSSSGH